MKSARAEERSGNLCVFDAEFPIFRQRSYDETTCYVRLDADGTETVVTTDAESEPSGVTVRRVDLDDGLDGLGQFRDAFPASKRAFDAALEKVLGMIRRDPVPPED